MLNVVKSRFSSGKNLVRFSIFIWIYYLLIMVWITEIRAQDWQCNPAVSNTCINSNVYLSENSVAVNPLKPNIILNANNYDHSGIGGGEFQPIFQQIGVLPGFQLFQIMVFFKTA